MPSLSDYQLGNDFVARDVLLALKGRAKPPYITLTIPNVSPDVEGVLEDVQGGTAMLKSGSTVRLIDVDRVVAIRVVEYPAHRVNQESIPA